MTEWHKNVPRSDTVFHSTLLLRCPRAIHVVTIRPRSSLCRWKFTRKGRGKAQSTGTIVAGERGEFRPFAFTRTYWAQRRSALYDRLFQLYREGGAYNLMKIHPAQIWRSGLDACGKPACFHSHPIIASAAKRGRSQRESWRRRCSIGLTTTKEQHDPERRYKILPVQGPYGAAALQ